MTTKTQALPDEAEQLSREARSDDEHARNRLITNHLGMIRAFVRRKVPKEDVEDVTQEVALAATQAFPTFRGSSPFGAWLRTITRRAVADYHQGRDLAGGTSPTEISEVDPREQDAFEAMEDHVDVAAALVNLSRRDQALLELRVGEGLSFAEVGERIGVSEGAAKMQFRRAMLKVLAS